MTDFKKWFAARARNPAKITLEEALNPDAAEHAAQEKGVEMIDITKLRGDKRPQSSTVVHALIDRLEAAEKSDAESIAMYRKVRDERDALRAEIEELHALIAAVKKQADAEFCLRVKKEEEYARLRAKIEQMEKQRPIGLRFPSALRKMWASYEIQRWIEEQGPLYALPGAKGE